VLKPEARGTVSDQDIRAHLMTFVERKQISKYAVPDRVLFVEAIEKTSVGKLDKKLLRQKYDA
jgi:fatty-acyl-CoA synthase